MWIANLDLRLVLKNLDFSTPETLKEVVEIAQATQNRKGMQLASHVQEPPDVHTYSLPMHTSQTCLSAPSEVVPPASR